MTMMMTFGAAGEDSIHPSLGEEEEDEDEDEVAENEIRSTRSPKRRCKKPTSIQEKKVPLTYF